MQWLLGRSLFVIKFCSTLWHYIFRLGSNLLGSSHSFKRKKRLRQQDCVILYAHTGFPLCVWLSHLSCCTSDFVDIRAVRVPSLSLLFRPVSSKLAQKLLQKLQNRAARVPTFSRYDADANCLFRQLNWKDLSTQFQMQKALMVCKSLNNLVPGYLSSKFVKRYETRYSLRDSVNKVIVPFPRTNFMKNSFSYSGAVLWNSLPCDMREAKSSSQFKWLAHLNFCFFPFLFF